MYTEKHNHLRVCHVIIAQANMCYYYSTYHQNTSMSLGFGLVPATSCKVFFKSFVKKKKKKKKKWLLSHQRELHVQDLGS